MLILIWGGVSDPTFLFLGETQAGIPLNTHCRPASGAVAYPEPFSLQELHLPLFLFKDTSRSKKKHAWHFTTALALESDKFSFESLPCK